MSDTEQKSRTVLKLHGLKLVDTVISNDGLAHIISGLSEVSGDSISVVLQPEDDVMKLESHLPELKLIAITFPVFTDGRGYSQAALLRKRLNYKGALRAVGDVLVDQVAYLARAGFDEIELRDDQSLAAAQRALKAFTAPYQSAQDSTVPVWHRYAGAQA
jgi:uncharacterized protein (DUF934 family)